MTKRPKFPDWLAGFGIFMLKSLGWIVTATLVIFATSYFVKLPSNRADLFSLIEVLFGVIITALSIVASFAVSFNWGNLDSNLRKFTEASQRVGKQIDDQNKNIQGLRKSYTTLRAEYVNLQGNIDSLIKEALDIKKFIEESGILDRSLKKDREERYLLTRGVRIVALSHCRKNQRLHRRDAENWVKTVAQRGYLLPLSHPHCCKQTSSTLR